MTLLERRDEAVRYHQHLQARIQRLRQELSGTTLEMERVVGRVTTLNELIEESKAPTEGQEGDVPGTDH